MQINAAHAMWLDPSQDITIDELIGLSGFTENEVLELVDADALTPTDPLATLWTFNANCVLTVRRASRLRDDLELDMQGLALALTLLEQIRVLEAELSQMRAQRPSFRYA